MKKVDKILFAETTNQFYFPYQNCYFPLKRHCKEIVSFDVRWNYFYYGKDEMNKRFLSFIEKEKPDMIFIWARNDEFYPETLLKIREISPKSQVFNIFGDDDAAFKNFSRYFTLFVDYALTGQPEYINEYHKDKFNKVFFIIGLDTNFFKPISKEKKYDVTFIGHPKTKLSERYQLLKFLKDNNVNLKVYGWGWDKYSDFKNIYGGAIDSEEMVKIINQSKIHLCFSKNHLGVPHIVGKFFEGSACRTFVLTEYYEGYKEFFKEGKEIVMFKNKEDLLDKIKYFLKNENKREKIAEAAYKKIRKNYGFDNDLTRIFKKLTKKKILIHDSLPKVNKNIFSLSKHHFDLTDEEIFEIIKDSDYISFSDKGIPMNYKDYLQVYSIERTGKPISCCDYYLHSKYLGDYLRFQVDKSMDFLSKEDFYSFLKIDQILVKKDYFIKNISEFKSAFKNKKIEFINNKNTAIINLPLLRINKIKSKNYETMKTAFEFGFLHDLISLKYQKKFFTIYPLALFFEILKGKFFILNSLIENVFDKDKIKKLNNLKTV